MTGEAREWDDVRDEAISAITEAAIDLGFGDILAGHVDRLADAILAVLDEEAVNRMADTFVNETRIRAIDFRNGMDMDLEPSETLVANWVAAAKTFLDANKAINYTETEVKIKGGIERYAFILQRVGHGKLTPHEARKQAEAERDEALAELETLRGA